MLLDGVLGEMAGDMIKVYKRWKIGNIGYIVGRQGLKWQQIGNTIGNNRQQPKLGLPLETGSTPEVRNLPCAHFCQRRFISLSPMPPNRNHQP